MGDKSILQDLRELENQLEEKLKNAQDHSKKRIEQTKKELDNQLDGARMGWLKEKGEAIRNAEEEALRDAKKRTEGYNKKKSELKKLFLKNKEKAVEIMVEDVLGNV